MFWGGTMFGRRTPLTFIEETMTCTIDVESIIETIIQRKLYLSILVIKTIMPDHIARERYKSCYEQEISKE